MPLPAILVSNLIRTYRAPKSAEHPKGHDVRALDNIDLTVPQGEFFGLLGPNGAGKTTLIKVLVTLLLPTSGRAEVAGFDVVRTPGKVRERIAMVSGGEHSGYGLLTVREQLWMFSQFYGLPSSLAYARIDALLKVLDLYDSRDKKVGDLSTGMRQKLNLIRGLVPDPEVLFLDEPTVGLDVSAARDIRAYLKEWMAERSDRTVLLTTHYLNEADELCDRVAIIHKGTIVACDAPDVLRKSGAGETYFLITTDPIEVASDPIGVTAHRVGITGDPIDITTSTSNMDGARRASTEAIGGADWLAALPGVRHVDIQAKDGSSELRLELERDGAIAGVVQALSDRHKRIFALQKVEPTLEDVFVKLVGRRLDEADEGDGS